MRRPIFAVLSAVAIVAAGFGCNAIVGNDEHHLETNTCTAGDTQCQGNIPQTCDANGQWQDGTACPAQCTNGMCESACAQNDKRCMGDTLQVCDAHGMWQTSKTCPFVCSAGACAGTCVPGAKQCANNAVETCGPDGEWKTGETCPKVCSDGMCAGKCTPGSKMLCGSADTCNAGGTQICDDSGAYGPCTPAASPCAATPTGWSPVALTNGACPSGFGMPEAFVSGATASPYTCSCGCGGTQACSGTAVLNHYSNGGCMGSPADSNPVTFSTSCGPGGAAIAGGDGYLLSNVAFGPGPACATNPMATSTPMPNVTHITVCTPDLTCTDGACLSAAEQASLCVEHDGMQACPAGFPTATLIADDISDTRDCGSCACGSSLGCTFQSLLVDNDSACGTMNIFNFVATTSTCAVPANSFPFNATKATATVTGTGTCAETSPSNPIGGVGLDPMTLKTICCP
jgi:hypothetical protein